jgi:hypothetical protein
MIASLWVCLGRMLVIPITHESTIDAIDHSTINAMMGLVPLCSPILFRLAEEAAAPSLISASCRRVIVPLSAASLNIVDDKHAHLHHCKLEECYLTDRIVFKAGDCWKGR